MMKIKKQERGEMVIAFLIVFLLLVTVFIGFTKIFPLYDVHSRLTMFGKEVLRTAELTGQIDVEVKNKVDAMKDVTKLNPAITWNKTGKLPLGTEIEVTLELTEEVNFGGAKIIIPVKVVLSGRSEVYWKN